MKNQNLNAKIERKNVKEQKKKVLARVPALDGPYAWANLFFKGRTIPLFLDNSSSTLTDDILLISP
jgi:hypothetical protein